jgi:hypothetical protein
MARVLTVRRAQVPPAREPEYRALLAELTRVARAHGARRWSFRSRHDAGAFLEFREAGDDSAARIATDEAALEARLREVATYAPGGDEVWEEVIP